MRRGAMVFVMEDWQVVARQIVERGRHALRVEEIQNGSPGGAAPAGRLVIERPEIERQPVVVHFHSHRGDSFRRAVKRSTLLLGMAVNESKMPCDQGQRR